MHGTRKTKLTLKCIKRRWYSLSMFSTQTDMKHLNISLLSTLEGNVIGELYTSK